MHDPSTLAFTVRLPVPSRVSRRRDGRKPGFRWPFWITRRHEVYFGHDLVDVWHEEPGGADAGTVCGRRRLWTHWRHLRLRFPMARAVRRRLFTTCEWCGELGNRRQPVNVSHQWGGDGRNRRAHWWNGDRGLYHSECSSVANAYDRCVCETPAEQLSFRRTLLKCGVCDKIIDRDQARFRAPRLLLRKAGRQSRRPTAEEMTVIDAAFRTAQADGEWGKQ